MSRKFKWKPSYPFYRGCFHIARVFLGLFYWIDVRGRDNVPKGSALVCSNHSSNMDPIFVAFAFGIDYFLHFIAKLVLFKIPVVSFFVSKLGAISVDRDMQDIQTVKDTLSYLKKGEKVAIFPEGTRASAVDEVEAKSGAVKIAERAAVPIIPIYIPRKKRWFKKMPLIIGEPYYIEKSEDKRTLEDYNKLSRDLMHRIEDLSKTAAQ